MPFRSTRRTHHTTTTTAPRRGLFGRSKPAHHQHTTTTTRPVHHQAPVHHQKRHATFSDKISGAMLKLKGTLRGHPGEKAAGTRRMRGTDGRGSRRTRRHY
ncbi:hypothetical protein MGN70_007697 [Eutypa lata]|nr:hypothetical protein MGN70_007697 [Eutypa lata]